MVGYGASAWLAEGVLDVEMEARASDLHMQTVEVF